MVRLVAASLGRSLGLDFDWPRKAPASAPGSGIGTDQG